MYSMLNKEINCIDFIVKNVKRVSFFIPECVEHALVSYGETLGIDFVKAYAVSWKFDFEDNQEKNNNVIGSCIYQKSEYVDDYRKYNGIDLTYISVDSVEQLINVIIENCERNIPTIIHMDTYYSYWGFLYKKTHSGHVAVAVGIDVDEKKICIVDPDYSEKPFWVGFELLVSASKFYLQVIIGNEDKYTYDELVSEIFERKEQYMEQFSRIELFAKIFYKHFEPSNEFGVNCDIDDVLDSEMIGNIREIVKNRNMFIVFLEQIINKYSNIEKVIEDLYISIGKWNTIMNLFFKAARTGWKNDFNEKIYNILMSISQVEREAYNQLCDCKKNYIYKNEFDDCMKTKCITIDISKSCNNKGFIFKNNRVKDCDLTGVGEYIELNNYGVSLCNNEIAFKCFFENLYDNIICNGQIINLDVKGKVISIEMLVCAEWGGCEDSIKIISNLGFEYNKKIVAYDISEVNINNVLVIGKSKNLDGSIVNEQVGVTHNRIILDKEIHLKAIRLPVNPNMHIVAISILQRE